MPVTDIQLELIFRYFDNDLSDGEEEQLMEQLQQNAEMQQAFDQQVLMSKQVSEESPFQTGNPEMEAADDFVGRVRSLHTSNPEKKPAIVPITKRNYLPWIAAAAILFFILSGIIYSIRNRAENQNPVVKSPERPNRPIIKDSGFALPDSSRFIADNDLLQQLYHNYYTAALNDELAVPPAIKTYQWLYDHKRYNEIAYEKENALEVKGQNSPDEELKTIHYFNFYKALSNIQINKPAEAERLLTHLLSTTNTDNILNPYVKWYLLMVYLQKNDQANALLMVRSITSNKKNPYYRQAIEIQFKLSSGSY